MLGNVTYDLNRKTFNFILNIIFDASKTHPSHSGLQPQERSLASKLVYTPDERSDCVAGRPIPTVRWWRGETLVDSTDRTTVFPSVKNRQLVVFPLDRSHLHAVYTCQASNNNISLPVSASVTVEIHCEFIFTYCANISQRIDQG
ncbi:hypothetical protein AAG570_007638 [Ranatra chinensis]|uniref:Ig-like domain-containing protein n=1 Tax=Ranatra chinensis TaxID=642074 RepID=A0ABD0YCN2_9HEMI